MMTILVWGLILEILAVIYLSSTPWRFEFAYSLFLLVITSTALGIMIWRLKTLSARSRESPAKVESRQRPSA